MRNVAPAVLLAFFVLTVFLVIVSSSSGKQNYSLKLVEKNEIKVTGEPEISGWIAWWKEENGIDLINKHNQKLKTVSPFCYLIQKDLTIANKCKSIMEPAQIALIKQKNIRVVPTLGSDLRYKELSPLLNDPQMVELIAESVLIRIQTAGADGIDIDLEGIEESDREAFTNFIKVFRDKFGSNNLTVSTTLHAQDGKRSYQITKGQNLKELAEVSDEIRIMAYDQHGTFSESGYISSNKWLEDVVRYTITQVPREKIVIGIPAYGYIWETSGFSKGYQYDEFMQAISEKGVSYESERDPDSSELIFKSDQYEGWLSDSTAIISKMNTVRSLGINRFVLWNLGGIDETLFEHQW